MVHQEKTIIGRTAFVAFPKEGIARVPAKIDTGADSSSIWASELEVDQSGRLHYALFAEGSPFYTGVKHSTKSFEVRLVRSSNGTAQIRYSVKLTVELGGRQVRAVFTLADRSRNSYPILIGKKTLYRKFLVDVSKGVDKPAAKHAKSRMLNTELAADPKAFFEKYHQHNPRGDVEL